MRPALITALLASISATAQPPAEQPSVEELQRRIDGLERRLPPGPLRQVPEQQYARVIEVTIDASRHQFDNAKSNEVRSTVEGVVLRAKVLGGDEVPLSTDTPSAAVVDYAVASIKTGVEGAEAGVIVAPLSLMGRDTGSSTWTVTAATLKENKTRLSTAYAYEPTWTLLFLKDIGLKSCEFTDKVQDKLKQSLIEREPAFREVCEVLVAALEAPPPEEDDQRALGGWHTARKACGFESLGAKEQVPTLRVAVDNFRRQLARARNRFAATDMRRAEFERRATAVHDSLEVLNSFAMPFPDSCIKDKAIDAAVLRTAWERRRYRIGVALVYDTFPLQFGFNPSKAPGDEPLPKWEYSSAGVRADVEMHEQAFDCRLGLGVARERGALGDKIVTNLSGIFSASTLLMVVGGGSILQEDGTTAPYLTGGLRIAAKLAPSPPPTQAKLVSEAEAAVFFDFRVNESLTIRFDIPVKAKLVPDKPEDSRTGKRDLQGAIPLAITAALKL